ncbi:MAG: hypothetical protein R2710_07680 [Acidimicrobiales bacterium]
MLSSVGTRSGPVSCSAIYAVGVGIGFRYLRQATKGYDCSGDTCTLE